MSQAVEVSIIIPTLRECESLAALLPRLFTVLQSADLAAEVLVVDDNSRDGTDALCSQLAQQHAVRLITRTAERGLATAVLKGLSEAAGEICVVMDADGSHPPDAVPDLVAAVRSPFCDVSIGSRYIPGGSADENWGWFRRLNSSLATLLARGLTRAADPLAGFFAVRKSTLAQAKTLCPLGYKILLEIIVRADCRRIVEVPIHFQDRKLGQSKLSIKQQWLYLRHLAKLYAVRYLPAWADRTPTTVTPTLPETPRRKTA
ncbi:MAG TPA: polyprenol monophosphomannose synthase [Lacipirellulaceae bacterium]|jgi:dolichol-phosphate mannosyltransferase|nr:polyprenol monophosphomannose synthase [Lacipirellulaceae bacterium]